MCDCWLLTHIKVEKDMNVCMCMHDGREKEGNIMGLTLPFVIFYVWLELNWGTLLIKENGKWRRAPIIIGLYTLALSMRRVLFHSLHSLCIIASITIIREHWAHVKHTSSKGFSLHSSSSSLGEIHISICLCVYYEEKLQYYEENHIYLYINFEWMNEEGTLEESIVVVAAC